MKISLSLPIITSCILFLSTSCTRSTDLDAPGAPDSKDTLAVPKPAVKIPTIERMYKRIDSAGGLTYFYGNNFSRVASENIVIFNGDSVQALSVSDSLKTQWTLTVKIPPNAVSGKVKIKVNGIVSLPSKDTLFIIAKREWKELAPFPGKGRIVGASFSINGKGYVMGGISQYPGTYYKDFYEYDPKLNKWTRKKDYPGLATFSPFAFVIGNKAYVGGGMSYGIGSQDFYEFDPETDNWTRKANIPTQVYASTGATLGQVGYLIDDNNKLVFTYDPKTNLWTRKGTIEYSYGSTPRDDAAFVLGGKLYFGYGYINHFENNNVYVSVQNLVSYNSTVNSWNYDPIGLVDMDQPRAVTKVEVYGRKIYTSFGDIGLLKEYDAATGKAINFIDKKLGFISGGMSFLIGSEYYVTGGQDDFYHDGTQKLWKIYLEAYKR